MVRWLNKSDGSDAWANPPPMHREIAAAEWVQGLLVRLKWSGYLDRDMVFKQKDFSARPHVWRSHTVIYILAWTQVHTQGKKQLTNID